MFSVIMLAQNVKQSGGLASMLGAAASEGVFFPKA